MREAPLEVGEAAVGKRAAPLVGGRFVVVVVIVVVARYGTGDEAAALDGGDGVVGKARQARVVGGDRLAKGAVLGRFDVAEVRFVAARLFGPRGWRVRGGAGTGPQERNGQHDDDGLKRRT